MLTKNQKFTIKRAQMQIGLEDEEYRDCLAAFSGDRECRTSTDPGLNNDQFDRIMKGMEAIYWRMVEHGDAAKPPNCEYSVFRVKSYWKNKNTPLATSRERYCRRTLESDVIALENRLIGEFGFHPRYLEKIGENVNGGGGSVPSNLGANGLAKYKAALERTLAWKQKKQADAARAAHA